MRRMVSLVTFVGVALASDERVMRILDDGPVEDSWVMNFGHAVLDEAKVVSFFQDHGASYKRHEFGEGEGSIKMFTVQSLKKKDVEKLEAEMGPKLMVEEDRSYRIEGCREQKSTYWGQGHITGGGNNVFQHNSAWGTDVDVYILDTGIRCSHTELSGRCRFGESFAGGATGDWHGHGTHVAGTVAGKKFGIAPAANVIDVKVLGDWGHGRKSWFISGMEWVQKQAKKSGRRSVVNMSLGGSLSWAVNEAADALVKSGVTVVVAAGNDAIDACVNSPGSTPSVITVASSTKDNEMSYFSNLGSCVDIIAPGSGIVAASHYDDESTRKLSGTSMAAPHVAGAAAVYLSENAWASPDDVLQWMMKNGKRGEIKGLEYKSVKNTVNLLLHIPCSGSIDRTLPTPSKPTPSGTCRTLTNWCPSIGCDFNCAWFAKQKVYRCGQWGAHYKKDGCVANDACYACRELL